IIACGAAAMADDEHAAGCAQAVEAVWQRGRGGRSGCSFRRGATCGRGKFGGGRRGRIGRLPAGGEREDGGGEEAGKTHGGLREDAASIARDGAEGQRGPASPRASLTRRDAAIGAVKNPDFTPVLVVRGQPRIAGTPDAV